MMENLINNEIPVIGKDISWEAIEGEFCRIEHFTPFAIVESGKVKAASSTLPYASLRVELPELSGHPDYQKKLKNITLPREALMPVIHKLDFRNLWEVFKETNINQEIMEVIVVYAPLKRRKIMNLFSSVLPSLVIQLHGKGALERLYRKPETGNIEDWVYSMRPIAEWDARPENLK
jgi:hypothetical protein